MKGHKLNQETLEALYSLLPKVRRDTLKSWGPDIVCRHFAWLDKIILNTPDEKNEMYIIALSEEESILRVIWDTSNTRKTDNEVGWEYSHYNLSSKKFHAIFELLSGMFFFQFTIQK